MAKPAFDEKDQKIVQYLFEHPDATIREIASGVAIPEATVERHRSKLIEEKVLLPSCTLIKGWAEVDLPWRFRVDITINQLEVRDGTRGGGPADCPTHLQPNLSINTQERLATFIKEKLVEYVAWRISEGREVEDRPSAKHVKHLSADEFRRSIVVQDVTILLGAVADLTATVRAGSMHAMRMFVTSGLRMMRGISTTSTAHEVWSYMDTDI